MTRMINFNEVPSQLNNFSLNHFLLTKSTTSCFNPNLFKNNSITLKIIHKKPAQHNTKQFQNLSYRMSNDKTPKLNFPQTSTDKNDLSQIIFHNSELNRLMRTSLTNQIKQKKQNKRDSIVIHKISTHKSSDTAKKLFLRNNYELKNKKEMFQIKLLKNKRNFLIKSLSQIIHNHKDYSIEKNINCISCDRYKSTNNLDNSQGDYSRPICGIYFKGSNLRKKSLINQRKKQMENEGSFGDDQSITLPEIKLMKKEF